ncbi:hypothetical protein AAFF_G00174040 [Aldrovandia affinis]|uniref:Uncharacterized protein n=1 Tax=Aldrovandia affinis TaxID=143900 RepID=A0AAD7SZ78_9TELE|nr:hypothetical protein AAFF_G00174040 [Aldrovandia affinis]
MDTGGSFLTPATVSGGNRRSPGARCLSAALRGPSQRPAPRGEGRAVSPATQRDTNVRDCGSNGALGGCRAVAVYGAPAGL